MPIIRFGITKNSEEWDKIKEVIKGQNQNKKRVDRGEGFNQFIASETNKAFQHVSLNECADKKVTAIKKSFDIEVSEETAKKIACMSETLRIPPGALIAKMTLDPHLVEINK